jgi:hypothetical protein
MWPRTVTRPHCVAILSGMPATAKPQLTHPGDHITFEVDRYTITLQYVRPGAFTVTVYQGGTLRISTLSASYPTEPIARDVARTIARHLLAGHDLETARLAVLAVVDGAQAVAQADDSRAGGARSVALADVRAQMESHAERAWAAEIAARLNADLDARAAGSSDA